MSFIDTSHVMSFDAPPLVEVVCGVTFEPVRDFSSTYYGRLWECYRDDFPVVRDLPPIPPPQLTGALQINVGNPLPRVWFVSRDEQHIIQVQPDRFLFNWKRGKGNHDYPRFSVVFEAFTKHLNTLQRFLKTDNPEALRDMHYELTYINHIETNELWEDLKSVGRVLPDIDWRNGNRFLPAPEHITAEWGVPLSDGTGVLVVSVVSGRDKTNGKRVLQLRLTTQGMAQTVGGDRDKWFKNAHDWIVRGFDDITSEEIKRTIWNLKGSSE